VEYYITLKLLKKKEMARKVKFQENSFIRPLLLVLDSVNKFLLSTYVQPHILLSLRNASRSLPSRSLFYIPDLSSSGLSFSSSLMDGIQHLVQESEQIPPFSSPKWQERSLHFPCCKRQIIFLIPGGVSPVDSTEQG
jgi:hypothetical protein